MAEKLNFSWLTTLLCCYGDIAIIWFSYLSFFHSSMLSNQNRSTPHSALKMLLCSIFLIEWKKINSCFVVLKQHVAQRWLLCDIGRVILPLLFLSNYAKFALSDKNKRGRIKNILPTYLRHYDALRAKIDIPPTFFV